MVDGTSRSSTHGPRPKRHKIDLACDTCRTRKVKCDGNRPACGNCVRRSDLRCHYTSVPSERAPKPESQPEALRVHVPTKPQLSAEYIPNTPVRGQTLRAAAVPAPPSSAGSKNSTPSRPVKGEPPSPSGIDSMTTVLEDGEHTQQYFGSSSAGSFTQRIKSAIDAKLGVSTASDTGGTLPATTLGPTPAVGALEYTLPPRRTADRLIGVYWYYVDPLYPFLERRNFEQTYERLFTGTPVNVDERIFVTTLNVMFALSTQLLESLEQEYRDDSSNLYFRKAQDLLPLNLFNPGSLELVQCLLLMSQYLQCTNCPHQMWMVVGAAVRTAQSMGLHLSQTSDVGDVQKREILRRLWYGCVLMDRVVSVTHGRPAMISQKFAAEVPLPLSTENNNTDGVNAFPRHDFSRIAFFVKSVELYEIINRMTMTVHSSGSTKGSEKEPCPTQAEDTDQGLESIIEFDESLSQWEKRVPDHLNIKFLELSTDEINKRQAVILRIRFLQARLLLLRPILFRFCLEAPPQPAPGDGLRQRVLRECTLLCVSTAQGLVSILSAYQTHDGTIGLLPAWWYRVYYVFSAATILVVAKLRPELFDAQAVTRSWDEALAVLSGHEKFGRSARRCVAVLEILSDKVLHIGGSMAAGGQQVNDGPEAQADQYMDEVGEYPEINLEGLDFDASEFNVFNTDVWGLLNLS